MEVCQGCEGFGILHISVLFNLSSMVANFTAKNESEEGEDLGSWRDILRTNPEMDALSPAWACALALFGIFPFHLCSVYHKATWWEVSAVVLCYGSGPPAGA